MWARVGAAPQPLPHVKIPSAVLLYCAMRRRKGSPPTPKRYIRSRRSRCCPSVPWPVHVVQTEKCTRVRSRTRARLPRQSTHCRTPLAPWQHWGGLGQRPRADSSTWLCTVEVVVRGSTSSELSPGPSASRGGDERGDQHRCGESCHLPECFGRNGRHRGTVSASLP